MNVREFCPADLVEVFALVERTFTERYYPQSLMDLHRSWPEGFMVIEDEGRILGMIAGIMINHLQARVMLLGVRQGYQGRGLGSLLMEHFEALCHQEGMMMVSLEVRATSTRVIDFYWRIGYQVMDVIPCYYQNGDGAYVMKRMLQLNI